MCHLSKLHQRPSLIIESRTWPCPMRRPSRARASRYGALLIDSMPPATTTRCVAGGDPLRRQHHGLEPRPADLVDGQRRHAVGQPSAQRGLSRRRLAEAGRDDVAHDAFLDDRRVDAGAAHGLAHDHRPQLRRGEVLERAEELPGGQADGRDDDGVHDSIFSRSIVRIVQRSGGLGR